MTQDSVTVATPPKKPNAIKKCWVAMYDIAEKLLTENSDEFINEEFFT